MVHLILGRAGTGKTARIFEEIANEVRAGHGGLVLLVPEQYSHEAERELCRAAGDSLSLYGEVLSFTGLARRVLARYGGARPTMDRGGRLLCMAVAMEAAADGLRVYRRGRRDGRLLDSLTRGIDQLRNAGLGAEELADSAGRFPGLLGEKLTDLSLLMEAYTAAEGRSAADPADVMEALAERIGGSEAARSRFWVDGFSDFTVLEKNVLRELIRAGAELTVCLTCARTEGEELFSLPAETARWLRRTAEEYGQPWEELWMEPEGDDTPLRFFCEHLFDFSRPPAPANDGALRLVRAAGPYEECELAAAAMAELARSGARWREMAVAVRGFGDYRAALESACARYGVPLFLSGRGDLMRRSVPLLIASCLEAVCRGYEYEAVFGYLKTGLSPLALEECDRLENYVILWNIRGAMWSRPFTMHPEGYNRTADEASQAALAELNSLRERVIAPLTALERAASAAATARAQAAALAEFLMSIRLPERLEQRASELEAAGRLGTAAEYEQLWDVVCTALEQFAAVLGDMPMDAERFRELFCLMLSKYDIGVIPVSLDRVQAGDFDGMRRRHVRHLFVLGAAEGRLPAPEEEGGVFTPSEREELSALGLSLGTLEEELQREFGRIYSCLTLPSDTLYISWPETDMEGSESRPSRIALRAEELFGLAPERGDLRRARTFSREAAFTLAVEGAAGAAAPECAAARALFCREGRSAQLEDLVRAASASRGSLGPEAVRALYGERPSLSPTRAERFGDCRFEYFLQYGLKAKPRQRAVFDPRDYGTFMHYVLENVTREVMERGGFPNAAEEEIRELTDQWVDRYIHEEMNDFAEKTARFEYLFRRLRTAVRQVTAELWRELKDSRFQPIDLELDLTAEGVLEPTEEEGPRLTGRADRVDGWVRDGVLYLRVVDYKTGEKKFDLADVCEGVNLQMLLYLFALQKRGRAHFGAEEIRPAGVLYVPARHKPVRADGNLTAEELESQQRAGVRRSGLVLADPQVIEAMEPGEEKRYLPVRLRSGGGEYTGSVASLARFGALSRYIDATLRELAAQLRAGSVAADPWFKNARENACAYCDYRKACLFDEERDPWRVRQGMTTEDAWQRIEEDRHE